MWDLPPSGIEPVSPALAGGFFTTDLPGRSWHFHLSFSLLVRLHPIAFVLLHNIKLHWLTLLISNSKFLSLESDCLIYLLTLGCRFAND